MDGPRGLAAFLFFLGLSFQVSAGQEVILIKGAGEYDGLYTKPSSTKNWGEQTVMAITITFTGERSGEERG